MVKKISIAQAAALEGLCQKTIRRRIADGTLKAYRLGPRLIRVDAESLSQLARPMVTA